MIKGIDISDYQRGLSVASLKAAGIDFVILKLGYGTTVTDACFAEFYEEAVSAGLAVGAYFFGLATTPENAVRDARKALSIANGRELPLGIFFDVETDEQMSMRDSALTEVVKTFCDTIRAAGYRPGAYGSNGRLWAKVGASYLGEDVLVWNASWSGSPPSRPCDVWQNSESGRVPGFNGPVDTDFCMSERFEALIKGEGQQPTPKPTPEPKKDEDTTEAAYFPLSGVPVLRYGDRGDAVKAMQGELIAFGYSCGGKRNWRGAEIPDGIFGNVTAESVRSFQRSKNITDNGIVGPKTRAALLGVKI